MTAVLIHETCNYLDSIVVKRIKSTHPSSPRCTYPRQESPTCSKCPRCVRQWMLSSDAPNSDDFTTHTSAITCCKKFLECLGNKDLFEVLNENLFYRTALRRLLHVFGSHFALYPAMSLHQGQAFNAFIRLVGPISLQSSSTRLVLGCVTSPVRPEVARSRNHATSEKHFRGTLYIEWGNREEGKNLPPSANRNTIALASRPFGALPPIRQIKWKMRDWAQGRSFAFIRWFVRHDDDDNNQRIEWCIKSCPDRRAR